MQGKRSLRVGELLHQEIAHLFAREMKDPRLALLTVASVIVSDDLKHAKVYISIYGREPLGEEIIPALKGAEGFIRGQMGKKLNLKHIPHLSFLVDESAEHSIKISKILDRIKDDGYFTEEPAY